MIRQLAAQYLTLAEAPRDSPLTVGHRQMGTSLLRTGDVTRRSGASRSRDDVLQLGGDPPPPTRVRPGGRAATLALSVDSIVAAWLSRRRARSHERAVALARAIDHAATLMYALMHASLAHIHFGRYAAANVEADEVIALADEKGALIWKALGTLLRGSVSALTGKPSDAVQMISSGISTYRLPPEQPCGHQFGYYI